MNKDYVLWRSELEKVLDPRFYDLAWLDRQVLGGMMLVWASDKAIILAEVRSYPTGSTELHGMLAAGDLDGVVELIADAEDWGRKAGCVRAVIASREGWGRVLKSSGYRLYQTSVEKDL